jgi:hypothetical protein
MVLAENSRHTMYRTASNDAHDEGTIITNASCIIERDRNKLYGHHGH